MAKFRKRPVTVIAEQFLTTDDTELPFADKFAVGWDGSNWYVTTTHGQKTIIVNGDWIIEEPDGNGYYPCKPNIFEELYERVPNDQTT